MLSRDRFSFLCIYLASSLDFGLSVGIGNSGYLEMPYIDQLLILLIAIADCHPLKICPRLMALHFYENYRNTLANGLDFNRTRMGFSGIMGWKCRIFFVLILTV